MKNGIKLLNFDDIKQESEERVVIKRRRKTKEEIDRELEKERMLQLKRDNHTYNNKTDAHIMNKLNKRK